MKNRIILIISIVSFVLLLGISGMIYSTSNSYYHAMHSQLAFSLKDNPSLLSIIICHYNKDSIYCGGGKLTQNREKTPINSTAYIKENGLSTPRPEYPRRAYALQVEGTLKIMFDVDDSGMTYNIKVVEEQPINMFKKEAIAAVSAWKFKPNTPISEVSISFDFKIDGQK
ncbi:TonB family protein [Serratia sp. (in: enterobacteria)]|uniref:TonB family protein n=1 Tax=Serratia sp. (in: enterobacteria) TaxID=616 RepID=UPI003989D631